jgi:hypothetical protein
VTVLKCLSNGVLRFQAKAWEAKQLLMKNYIQTKTEPPIFYLPKIMTAPAEEKLAATQASIDG